MGENDRIAILGWGSLIWDPRPEFDDWHHEWKFDGPELPLEFSRISLSRARALTLVIDEEHGSMTRVAWCRSRRAKLADAVCDLRSRERTTDANVAHILIPSDGNDSDAESVEARITAWGRARDLEAVVWTSLPSNFQTKTGASFSVALAIAHLQGLSPIGKVAAAEYVWRAPPFVQTPLRAALEVEPWFTGTNDDGGGGIKGRTP